MLIEYGKCFSLHSFSVSFLLTTNLNKSELFSIKYSQMVFTLGSKNRSGDSDIQGEDGAWVEDKL